ncbi:hypothetical protein PACTADRAFT_35121 [Pachysolen tannophilus NRRL Y-2460]|uniref:Uncharacterized protein n=1 Tax=Pachysolen tannophilus NRRL Y-2460 TaxID=669874 RepID=A0A1E4TRE5_PACTA|nr:hypothetical protein PACTADRAFT_35121 [Pachysolen tannophilus NRRL Y-2460]
MSTSLLAYSQQRLTLGVVAVVGLKFGDGKLGFSKLKSLRGCYQMGKRFMAFMPPPAPQLAASASLAPSGSLAALPPLLNNGNDYDNLKVDDEIFLKNLLYKAEFRSTLNYYSKFKYNRIFKHFQKSPQLIQELTALNEKASCFEDNENKLPDIGSLVEAQLNSGEVIFGIVIKPSIGKFNESLNCLQVFTIDGKFINIRPCDVTFHIYKFYNVKFLQNFLNSEIEDFKYSHLQQVQYSLILFIDYSLSVFEKLNSTSIFDYVFANISSDNIMKSLTLQNAYRSIPKEGLSNRKITPFAVLFALHLKLTNDPINYQFYKSSSSFNLTSNNNSNFTPTYFVNSKNLQDKLYDVIYNLHQQDFDEFNDYVKLLLQEIAVNGVLNSNLLKSFYYTSNINKLIVSFLKYYIVYPHELFEKTLAKVIKNNQDRSPAAVFKLLVKLNIYRDDEINGFDDPLLSTDNFFVHPKNQTTLAVLNTNQLSDTHSKVFNNWKFAKDDETYKSNDDNNNNNNNNESMSMEYQDFFKHLRNHNDLTMHKKDIQVFGIPLRGNLLELGFNKQTSDLCFSIEKINSRNWIVNIHLPDVGSFISPNSNIFKQILERFIVKDFKLPNGLMSFLPNDIINGLVFKEIDQQFEDYNEDEKVFNCITLSFQYRPRDDEKNFENPIVTLKLDKINDVKILLKEELDYALGNSSSFFDTYTNPNIRTSLDLTPITDIIQVLQLKRNFRKSFGSLNINFASQSLSVNNNHIKDDDILFDESKLQFKSSCNLKPFSTEAFYEELSLMIDEFSSIYSSNNHINAYFHTQTFREETTDKDDVVIVNPMNSLTPKYTASIFDHFLFERTYSNNLTPTSYFCCLEFLSQDELFTDRGNTSNGGGYMLYGLHNNLMKFGIPLSSLENLINQWQILKFLEKQFFLENPGFDESHLFLNGYLLNEEDKVTRERNLDLKSFHKKYISKNEKVIDFMTQNSKRYWVLKWLENFYKPVNRKFYEQNNLDNTVETESEFFPILSSPEAKSALPVFFKCVVFQSNAYPRLARAYCMELGIEVEILLFSDTKVVVGDRLVCTTIVYLDSISKRLVLMQ